MPRAGGVAAPAGVVRRADDGGDVDVAAARVAVVVVVVEAGVAAGALAVAPADAAVPADVVPADVAVAACAGSMTRKAMGGCWAQQVSKVSMMKGVVVAAGDECEAAWFGRMSCANGRTEADSVRGSFARLGKVAAKRARESWIAAVATWLIEAASRATDVASDLAEAPRRTNFVWIHVVETSAAADWPGRKLVAVAAVVVVVVVVVVVAAAVAAGEAEVIPWLYLASAPAIALSDPLADTAESRSKVAEVEASEQRAVDRSAFSEAARRARC